MAESDLKIESFGKTAQGLAKNPLGIIALFIVLIYGFASLVLACSNDIAEFRPLIWFLVVFPVLVLIIFAWLVSYHHRKLYAPTDYQDETNFLASINPELKQLTVVEPESDTNQDVLRTSNEFQQSTAADNEFNNEKERETIYEESRRIFITYILYPSEKKHQTFDVFIYLIRHKSTDFSDVESAEFFFGSKWKNRTFSASYVNGVFGIRTSAYGPFLCMCHLRFKDGTQKTIHRYIDFEMGKLIKTQSQ